MSDLKSVIEIDVEDARFKEFQEAFGKYQEALENLPDGWKEVGQAINENTKKADDLHPRMDKLKRDLDDSAKKFTSLVSSSFQLSKNVASITLDLAKWVSLSSIALGAGGMFGFGSLAGSAGELRKTSQGLDVKPEELQAANIDLTKALANPGQSLARTQQVQADLSQRWAFNALRINPAGKDTAQLQSELMQSARTFWEAMPKQQRTTQTMQAYGLDKFFSLQELNRMTTMREAEFKAMMANYDADRQKLAMSDETLRKWQDLNRQFDRFKTALQNDMIIGFEKLAPQLGDFSAAVEEAFKTLTGSEQVKIWIEDAANGIKDFAKYLTSPEFKTDMDAFLSGIDKAAGAVWGFATKIMKLIEPMVDEKSLTGSQYQNLDKLKAKNPALGNAAENFLANPSRQTDTTAMSPLSTFIREYNASPENKNKIAPNDYQGAQAALVGMGLAQPGKNFAADAAQPSPVNATPVPDPGFFDYRMNNGKLVWLKKFQNQLGGLDFQAHWDMGLLDRLYYAESSRGVNRQSPKGAQGGFGFMPATAKEYGIKNINDDWEAAKAAQRYLMKLRDQFGDMEKAVAAYNYGPGNLSKLMREHPGDWRQRLPAETQREINVVVYNNTGGNAATSVNQVAR